MDAISPDILAQFQPQVAENEKPRDELGQNEFMKLMLTQLRHQDPFKPMENGEFIAQMAQFSTVAGIDDMRQSLDEFAQGSAASQTLHAASLLDRKIAVRGDTARVDTEGQVNFEYSLPANTENATAVFSDALGNTIERVELGAKPRGDHNYQWTPPTAGTDEHGENIPAQSNDEYTIVVEYPGSDGETIAADIFTIATVESVRLNQNGSASLLATSDGRQVALADVKKFL